MANRGNDLANPSGGAWEPSEGLARWEPDLPPASLSALDDYFTAPTLDAKWAVSSPGGNFAVNGGGGAGTLDTVRQMLRVTAVGDGTDRNGWVSQSLGGATEWVACTRVAAMGEAINALNGGLVVGTDELSSAPTTARLCTVEATTLTTNQNNVARTWSSYTAVASALRTYPSQIGCYVRARYNAGILERDVSSDGVEWWRMGASVDVTLAAQLNGVATRVGLIVNCTTNLATAVVRFPFFFFASGAGASAFDGPPIGRLAAMPLAT